MTGLSVEGMRKAVAETIRLLTNWVPPGGHLRNAIATVEDLERQVLRLEEEARDRAREKP